MLEIISTYLGIVILGIGEVLFAKIVLNSNLKTKKFNTISIICLSALLYLFFYIYLVGVIKSLLMYIIHMFEFKYLFKISFYKAIFLTFLYAVVLIIVDVFELLLFTNIIGIKKSFYYNNFAGSILGNLTICILFIILTYILRKFLRKIINTEISYNIKILFLSQAVDK